MGLSVYYLVLPSGARHPLTHLESELVRHPDGDLCLEHLVEESFGRYGLRTAEPYLAMGSTPERGYRLGLALYCTGLREPGPGGGSPDGGARDDRGRSTRSRSGRDRERLVLARRLFDQVLEQTPGEAERIAPLWMTGKALWHADRELEAEPYLREAVRLSGRYPDRIPIWLPDEDVEGIRALLGW